MLLIPNIKENQVIISQQLRPFLIRLYRFSTQLLHYVGAYCMPGSLNMCMWWVHLFVYLFIFLMFTMLRTHWYYFPYFTHRKQRLCKLPKVTHLVSGWDGIWTWICLNRQPDELPVASCKCITAVFPTVLSLPHSDRDRVLCHLGWATWLKKACGKEDSGMTGLGVCRGEHLAFLCQKVG